MNKLQAAKIVSSITNEQIEAVNVLSRHPLTSIRYLVTFTPEANETTSGLRGLDILNESSLAQERQRCEKAEIEAEIQKTARKDMDRVATIWAERAEKAERELTKAQRALIDMATIAEHMADLLSIAKCSDDENTVLIQRHGEIESTHKEAIDAAREAGGGNK